MFAGSFNSFLFSKTMTVTVLVVESFYYIVWEKINGKFIPRVNMLSSTYHFPFSNTFLYRFASSFNVILFSESLTISVLIVESFYYIV